MRPSFYSEVKQLSLRGQIGSKVVEINGSFLHPTGGTKYFFTIGTIVVAKPEFCYIVMRRSLVHDNASYKIRLPDGSSMEIASTEFSKGQLLAGFYVYRNKLPYDTTRVAAVEFGSNVTIFDEVFLYDYTGTNVNFSGGHVLNCADDGFFLHDCALGPYTGNGAPLFYEDGKFIGICFLDSQGPITTLNVDNMKYELKVIYGTQTIDEFFEKVQELAEGAKEEDAAVESRSSNPQYEKGAASGS